MFILCCGAFVYTQIVNLTEPLEVERLYITGDNVINSTYAELEIIEHKPEYTVFRDLQTDVLYIELKRNGYSSALTVLLNADGSPKMYSQFLIDG